ncbi:ribosomal-protein-alanine N-acetyltransferase [Loktanella ponticola]|uniref:Ribosomal-protein-alanine N-acetyltransferase n=1 Tax=Yoonia ponticola TaxID=1524255 RepID=A0A7W9BKX4_9RHOB|nr:GNAT family N-acetyltransferase [Yoonia ponticola]MBB5722427.1 ribosomal-protein-alanine N-acetyltransferase [Yoonia ponticola]
MTPEALAQVHAAAFTQSRPWSAAEFAELLDSKGVILRGDVRSFVLGRLIADEAEVLTIATAPEFQRQGLAQICLAAFIDALQKQQAQSAFLEVAADNIAAKELYANNNFKNVGMRPNYYNRPDGTKVAAAVLRRTLVQA